MFLYLYLQMKKTSKESTVWTKVSKAEVFQIRSDKRANKRIKIGLNNYEEGIQFAIQNNCDGIDLLWPIGLEKIIVDLKLLEPLSHQLKFLSIDSSFKIHEHKNIHSIYTLKNLEKVILKNLNYSIDFWQFPNLIQIGMDYSKKFTNIDKLVKLETLVVWKYNEIDLTKISGLKSLRVLHLYNSKIEHLTGIEKLHNITELNLSGNNKLNDISILNSMSNIQKLHIERCSGLQDLWYMTDNKTLKDLFITEIKSINFISKMTNLEKIYFRDCYDGILDPLFKCKSLKTACITKNKRHYTHTQSEINEYLNKKWNKVSE